MLMLPLWYFAYKFGNLRSCIAQKETVFQLDSTTKMLQTRSPVNTLLCIWVFASQTSGVESQRAAITSIPWVWLMIDHPEC